ncbi:DUF6049 family protein [Williamsia sp. DF01-3]|uniref:DUF6049 family protein n=1 Tax=Williamsia sp. DF01-3 TaxID=2934157 RepID=UPI001FF3CAE3|nr:DUF6049 family protein [Williamsia sp. DF01-3]MCK0516316.1 DUF6049 family protein [Williamsia sp. DF01-3]
MNGRSMRALTILVSVLALVFGPLAVSAVAAPADDTSQTGEFLRISLESIDPSTVTTSSPGVVTASGTLTNVGDRPVRNIAMRLQRGAAITTSAGLGDSLSADANSFETVGDFTDVSQQLGPGRSIPFSLRIDLSVNASGAPSFQIDKPGVYPVLVNVNGTPDFGNPARLDDARVLLPVVGLPPNPLRAQSQADDNASGDPVAAPIGADGSVAPDISQPVGMTMLWPIAAPASLAPGVTGGGDETVRLMDNGLEQSLAAGGRLDRLVATMEQIRTRDLESPLARSLCLAVDPDLLISVQAMTGSYLVTTDPADPTGPAREGTGSEVAAAWLARLQALATGMCVVATPFAHVDITALTQVADSDLSDTALRAPADIVDRILNVKSVRGLAIPASGVLDTAGAELIRDKGAVGTVVAASSVRNLTPTSTNGEYPLGEDLAVQTYDPAVASGLSALGPGPRSAQVTPTAQRAGWLAGTEQVRRQNAVAAMMFSALAPSTLADDSGTADTGTQSSDAQAVADPIAERIGRGAVLVPPPTWSASEDDTRAVLSAMSLLLGSDLAIPRPLAGVATDLTATSGAPAGAELVAPPEAAVTGPDPRVIASVRADLQQTRDLQDSMTRRADVPITPGAYLAPLREDMLRAMASVAPQDQQAAARSASMRTSAVATTLTNIRNGVGILDPGGRFTLASERSPLLLVIRNDLPVAMRTRLNVSAPSGMTVGDMGVLEIPPRGTRQIQVPTRADRSRSITVEIGLVTTGGVPLGDSINLSVHSNAYGKPLFIITICAGALLVFLSGRRLWHRFRGEPDPADLDRPEPDERDRLMADSRALHSPPEREHHLGRHHPDHDTGGDRS